jgi:DNA repair protein RadC
MTDNETPHYAGHRARLKQKLLDHQGKGLQDYELLEILLFMAIPRKDVKPIAKDLLKRFGSLGALLAADLYALRQAGLTDNVISCLKIVQSCAHEMLRTDIKNQPVLNSWARLIDYCRATMAHETREHFRLLFLNRKNELIGDEVQGTGTVDQTPAYPREIVRRALELGATAIILVHNHPSGDPSPSKADIVLTRQVIDAAKPFNITIHDHVIVAKSGHSSMREMGLLH